MRIAILGWGSLLWDGHTEFDQWHGPWQYDGPTLKLEFSHISDTRLGALTLVIDEKHGTPSQVAWCLSKRRSLDDAVCDLKSREGTNVKNIGQVTLTGHADSASEQGTEDTILAWAREKKCNAVIWTALGSNFQKKTKRPFSVDSAVSYVKSLPPEGKAKAAEYVWRAPAFVKSPLRRALQKEPWLSQGGR